MTGYEIMGAMVRRATTPITHPIVRTALPPLPHLPAGARQVTPSPGKTGSKRVAVPYGGQSIPPGGMIKPGQPTPGAMQPPQHKGHTSPGHGHEYTPPAHTQPPGAPTPPGGAPNPPPGFALGPTGQYTDAYGDTWDPTTGAFTPAAPAGGYPSPYGGGGGGYGGGGDSGGGGGGDSGGGGGGGGDSDAQALADLEAAADQEAADEDYQGDQSDAGDDTDSADTEDQDQSDQGDQGDQVMGRYEVLGRTQIGAGFDVMSMLSSFLPTQDKGADVKKVLEQQKQAEDLRRAQERAKSESVALWVVGGLTAAGVIGLVLYEVLKR